MLGGLGSAPGAVLGAFLIGMAEELSVLVVGSQYRAAVGFVAILVVLTLRPRGLFGREGVLMLFAGSAPLRGASSASATHERHRVARSQQC